VIASSFITDPNFVAVLYIVSFALFIYGLSGLTGPKTAVRGNRIAAVGMAIAIIAALLVPDVNNIGLIILGVAIGTVVGVPAARQVKMTQMPQMVALFNGVGGGAVALIAWVEFRDSGGFAEGTPTYVAIFSCFAAIIGSVSFWGSNIAFAKLQELIDGKPVKPFGSAQVLVNGLLLLVAVGCGVAIVAGSHDEILIIALLVAAAIVGNFLVLPIGGADMPVVISTLNAFTGLSAAATGVALNNTSLIVAGMIVGASGTLLTQQMAVAMNRTITSVLLGGFGGEVAAAAGPGGASGTVRSTSAADVAIQMAYARQVVVVPGYGMAVSQAQHAVREMAKMLEAKGVTVKYAIHPVAGRMPGHMNVLLAEADVPYEQLKEMDDINGEFGRTDVSVVIGANDVTNPDARNKSDSPIYGMPILNVDESQSVIVLKRSMSSGYAGIDNPLFINPKTSMLFGDAKASVEGITEELKIL
jgi:NAD(P) transhydrogenase subunit beta